MAGVSESKLIYPLNKSILVAPLSATIVLPFSQSIIAYSTFDFIKFASKPLILLTSTEFAWILSPVIAPFTIMLPLTLILSENKLIAFWLTAK